MFTRGYGRFWWSQRREKKSTGVFGEFWGFTAAVSGRIWTPYSPWSYCLPLHCWLPLVHSDQAPGSFSDVFWNLAHWGALNAQRFSMVFTIISMIILGWFEGVIFWYHHFWKSKVCVAYVSTAEVWVDSAIDWTFHGLNKVSHRYSNYPKLWGAIPLTCALVMFSRACHNRNEYLWSQHFASRWPWIPFGRPASGMDMGSPHRPSSNSPQTILASPLSSATEWCELSCTMVTQALLVRLGNSEPVAKAGKRRGKRNDAPKMLNRFGMVDFLSPPLKWFYVRGNPFAMVWHWPGSGPSFGWFTEWSGGILQFLVAMGWVCPKFIQLGSEMVGINWFCSVFSPNLCHIIDLQILFLGSLQVSSHVQPMPSCSMAWSFRLPEVSFYLRCLESPSTKVSLRGSSKIETPSSGADTCASATQRGRCCHFASNLWCATWLLWMWWDLKGHLWVKMYTGPQVHNGPQIWFEHSKLMPSPE